MPSARNSLWDLFENDTKTLGREEDKKNFAPLRLSGKKVKDEMRKKEIEVRKKMVVVRMNESEYKQLEELHSKSTHKYLSTYARKVLLQKPVVLKYRNQSADEFLKKMIDLKKQLNGIGNNLNQAVHKLHMLEKIPEFRMWILNYDSLQKTLKQKVDEIKTKMEDMYRQLSLPHRHIDT